MKDLTGIGDLANSELAKRAYEDAASGPAKQVGEFATDSLKALRLFTAPIQLLAMAQDRFRRWLDEVRENVPEDRQIEAAPEIAGPVLMNLRFLTEENELRKLYLQLLTLAIDRENCKRAHPGFIQVIERMSPREATFLRAFSSQYDAVTMKMGVEQQLPAAYAMQQCCEGLAEWELEDLQSSLDLLRGLSVIDFSTAIMIEIDDDDYKQSDIDLTQFGKDFVAACLPKTN